MTARARHLLRTVEDALAALDLRSRVAAALPRAARSRVVAIGKAAPAMALGALDRWANEIEDVLVVVPDGVDATELASDDRVKIVRASHPVPDRRSRLAAEFALSSVAHAPALVLVSGGASALACAPIGGVSLAQKRGVTKTMLRSGASIRELNVVRKHLSRIKGGGLARAARVPLLTLVASDVIGGTTSDVGSGPSVADASTVRDARRLLERFAPRYARLPLAPTSSRATGRAIVIASPEELARRVARALDGRLLRPSMKSVELLAAEYLELADRLPRGTIVVRAAEPSLRVTRGGRGGRATHLATLVGTALPRTARFLAFATDGVDGASGTGGALVDGTFRNKASDVAIGRALARFDTGPLHRRIGTALPERPTGHNLTDLHVLAL